MRAPGDVLASLIAKQKQLASVEEKPDENAIELSTIHGAKGREWASVILVGAEDDQLPHRRTLEEADGPDAEAAALEDERRLAYVAITRASERFEAIAVAGHESRFLMEAGLMGQPVSNLPSGGPTVASRHGSAIIHDVSLAPSNVAPRFAKATSPTKAGHARPPATGAKPKVFAAKFAGQCPLCSRPINVGASIGKAKPGYVHEHCLGA
jgi:hypothetical protein